MKKMLILGGNGMAGHVLVRFFRELGDYEVLCTTRNADGVADIRLDARNLGEADRILELVRPDIVVNAIGILNHHAEADERTAYVVNGLFPHWIADKLDEMGDGGKLVQISTDCVFAGGLDGPSPHPKRSRSNDDQNGLDTNGDGQASDIVDNLAGDGQAPPDWDGCAEEARATVHKQENNGGDSLPLLGRYTERDRPDGTSVYARTKTAGEVARKPHLTVRTSIVGPEIRGDGIGLFEWFLAQTGTVRGYTGVLWNGVTTLQLARSITTMLRRDMYGLVHLTAPNIISKHELLHLFADIFNKRDAVIVPDGELQLDRTLRSTRDDWQERVPDYRTMLQDMYEWMWSC